jgi:hypothetical protein
VLRNRLGAFRRLGKRSRQSGPPDRRPPAVDLGNGVGIVPQSSGPATAVAKARGSIAQVESGREQLTGRVVPQPFDIELDASRRR